MKSAKGGGARGGLEELWREGRRAVDIQDAAAVALLLMSTVYLVGHNGGRNPSEMFWVLLTAAGATLLLLPALRRRALAVVLLIGGWSAAYLLATAAAEVRAEALRPLTAAALAPAVFLATVHVWRRAWGPGLLAAILAVAAVHSWWLTFLTWWGGSLGRPTWLALSWHNQSGTLMGAVGVAATCVAAVLWSQRSRTGAHPSRSAAAIAMAALIAGAALAGAWLSGSRGAGVATVLGLAAGAAGLWRGPRRRRAVVALAGIGAITVLVVVALEGMVQVDGASPMAGREKTAGHNMRARLGYWEAGLGMALARPITGWGPGSYPWASVPFYPSETTLTASAHNEYLEAVAEGGLLGAVPVWLAVGCIAWLALSAVLRPQVGTSALSRRAGTLAAAASATVLVVHAGADFDWDFPLLLALLAAAGGVLVGERETSGAARSGAPEPTGLLAVGAAGTALLLLLGTASVGVGLAREGRVPWELRRPLARSVAALQAGDIATAESELERASMWNPGAPPIFPLRRLAAHHRGRITDSALVAAVDPEATGHAEQLLIAARLLGSGNPAAARAVLDRLAPVLERRRAWTVAAAATRLAALRLAVEAALEGCEAAGGLVGPTLRWLGSFRVPAADMQALLDEASRVSGCVSLADSTA